MHTTDRPRRRHAGAAVLSAVVLAGAGWLVTGPASAAPQDLVLRLTGGTISIGASELEVPGDGGFDGRWDDETGALAGAMDLPDVTATVVEPVEADVVVTFSTPGDVTGTIDPATGAAALTVAVRADVDVTLAGTTEPGPPVECAVEPIEVDLAGTFDLETGALALSATGSSDGCDLVGTDIEGFLAGDTTVTLAFERVDQVTATTPSSTSSPEPSRSPAAQPVQQPARFTG